MLLILLFVVVFVSFSKNIYAAENPLSVPNNKFGIHILFPEEIDSAARLINSNGGDWGYVTIPIQAGDRNLNKWQSFMDRAKELRVVPIIRLAMVADYKDTNVWQKPTYGDVLDFANFLNSLNWPIKNRYVVIFNEPNRNAEWGGKANPYEYVDVLDYAVETFKNTNLDFFVISAGLDNGADTNSESINQYEFLESMGKANYGVFTKIDGISSHSYPNPGFSQPPTYLGKKGIASFEYEGNLIERLSGKKPLVFITETGWSKDRLSSTTIASYYKKAISTVWAKDNIVAITPFLLGASMGIFSQFSFLDPNLSPNAEHKALEEIVKNKGKPVLAKNENTIDKISGKSISPLNLSYENKKDIVVSIEEEINKAKKLIKWFLNI